jgi:endonuclease/exonuclease/phosphatase family metal-dependent hydrolase
VRLDVGGRPFTVFNCHLKSNPPSRNATFALRQAEARAIRHLVQRRFGGPEATAAANWAICGDLNDYLVVDGDPRMPDLVSGEWQESALVELLAGPSPLGVDVCDWIADPTDRWTSWYPRDDVYSQLDHIIVSPKLAALNAGAKVDIIRAGQPWRVARHTGARYPRVGFDRPKASDHCPIAVTLALA